MNKSTVLISQCDPDSDWASGILYYTCTCSFDWVFHSMHRAQHEQRVEKLESYIR